jgi:succinoglycan biosynthesis transport protein ExoP
VRVTIRDLFRVLYERWLLLVSVAALVVVAAGVQWLLQPKEYTATLTMYVAALSDNSPRAAYEGGLLSEQRIVSYVELLSSTRVTGRAVSDLALRTTPEAVARQVVAAHETDSMIISVSVVDESPIRAADIANALGREAQALIDELERPTKPDAVPPVTLRVVQPATPPTSPSSAGLPETLVIGLLAGLALGVGAAMLRNSLDTSVKSPEQLRVLTKAPSLGTVSFDASVPSKPLTLYDSPNSPRAEAFRQLRTNLQFIDVDNPRKTIIVTSPMPQEGKTTTLANLAIALADAGHRVVAVEADLRRPRLSHVLGLDRAVGLTSVLSGRVRLDQAVQHWARGVDVLAAGPLPPNPSEILASQQMASLLEDLRGHYDMILIDTPPLLRVTDAAAAAPNVDGVILLCRFHKTKRVEVARAVEALTSVGAPLLGAVLTMVPSKGSRSYARYASYYPPESESLPTTPARSLSTVRPAPRPRNGQAGGLSAVGPAPRPVNGQVGVVSAAAAAPGPANGQEGVRRPRAPTPKSERQEGGSSTALPARPPNGHEGGRLPTARPTPGEGEVRSDRPNAIPTSKGTQSPDSS